jgi:hypothetical protein
VAVTLGTDVGGVDFALAIGAAISGTVTREGDGVPLQDISVYTAREPDLTPDYDTALDFLLFGGSAKSGPSGSYQLVGLPNDDMYVYALDEQSAYLSEAYDNQADLVGATPVPTTAGVVMTQSLSGTVLSDSDGSPVPGLLVSVYETSTTKLAGQATTQSDGSFSVDGLFPGGFRVMVDGGDAYVSEYYADATNIADAQLVQVLGTDLTGIDFGLAAVDAVGPADVLITILSILLEEP